MSQAPVPSPGVERPRRPLNVGRLVVGALLVLVGIGWLLQELDLVVLPWRYLLPSALILVGVTLVAASSSGKSHGGLVALGIVLTLVLSTGTAVRVSFTGAGIGERTYRPTTPGARDYDLGIGSMTVDLTRLPLSRSTGELRTTVAAHVGIGELIVVVPRGALATVGWEVGAGQADIFGKQYEGVNVRNAFNPKAPSQESIGFELDLSVGLGQIRVEYG